MMKASQAISREVELNGCLILMQILIQNAGKSEPENSENVIEASCVTDGDGENTS